MYPKIKIEITSDENGSITVNVPNGVPAPTAIGMIEYAKLIYSDHLISHQKKLASTSSVVPASPLDLSKLDALKSNGNR